MDYEIVDALELGISSIEFNFDGNFDFEVIDEGQIEIKEKVTKVETSFPYGSYSKERTYRDYWLDHDQEFLASLVSVKVARMNKRGKVAILDDIREFRLLNKTIASSLCDSFTNVGYVFSVYGDE